MNSDTNKDITSSLSSQTMTRSKSQTLRRIAIADFEIQELIIDSYYSRQQASNRVMEIPLLLV